MGTSKKAARNKKTAVATTEKQAAPAPQGPGAVLVAQAATFSGPLPPPQILAGYDEVVPGAADRILKMAEQQAAHRQDMECRVVKANIIKSYLGIAAAFTLALVCVVGGVLAVCYGQPWGAAFGAAPIAGLAWVFIKGTAQRREEREAKSKQVAPVPR